jgi:hypothetical protein
MDDLIGIRIEFTHNPFITPEGVTNITTTPTTRTKPIQNNEKRHEDQHQNRGVKFAVARGVNFRLSLRVI